MMMNDDDEDDEGTKNCPSLVFGWLRLFWAQWNWRRQSFSKEADDGSSFLSCACMSRSCPLSMFIFVHVNVDLFMSVQRYTLYSVFTFSLLLDVLGSLPVRSNITILVSTLDVFRLWNWCDELRPAGSNFFFFFLFFPSCSVLWCCGAVVLWCCGAFC